MALIRIIKNFNILLVIDTTTSLPEDAMEELKKYEKDELTKMEFNIRPGITLEHSKIMDEFINNPDNFESLNFTLKA